MKRRNLVLAGAGAALALMAAAAGYWAVETRSQALLDARYPAPPSEVRAAASAEDVAAGRHLVQVTGCTFCHGQALTGPGPGPAAGFGSPNLTLAVGRRSDAELDRAIRWGLKADGTSELAMPSYAYRWLDDRQTAQIIGYLRTLAPQGRAVTPPPPGFGTRLALLVGRFRTEADRRAAARPPIEAGPQVEAGRRLAAVACGQCHGPDLSGGPGLAGPDMTVSGYFDRGQFHDLMRTGQMAQNPHSELMQEVARDSFRHFTPAEADAIYDYLMARDARLSTHRGAASGRQAGGGRD